MYIQLSFESIKNTAVMSELSTNIGIGTHTLFNLCAMLQVLLHSLNCTPFCFNALLLFLDCTPSCCNFVVQPLGFTVCCCTFVLQPLGFTTKRVLKINLIASSKTTHNLLFGLGQLFSELFDALSLRCQLSLHFSQLDFQVVKIANQISRFSLLAQFSIFVVLEIK